ncbi:MAG: hypothetical protein ACXVZT_10495 [Terriglobales bacterium]
MIGLAEKMLADLESLAEELRAAIVRDPQHPRADLEDVEWELEKRRWRKDSQPLPNLQTGTTSQPTGPLPGYLDPHSFDRAVGDDVRVREEPDEEQEEEEEEDEENDDEEEEGDDGYSE